LIFDTIPFKHGSLLSIYMTVKFKKIFLILFFIIISLDKANAIILTGFF